MQNVINKVQHEIKRGDIWLVNMPSGIGSEQTMINRPVVILQNNMGNKFSPTITICPLTSQQGKRWLPTHVKLFKTKCLATLSIALAEQITTISKERLTRFIGVVEKSEMFAIDDALMVQMGITPRNNVAYVN